MEQDAAEQESWVYAVEETRSEMSTEGSNRLWSKSLALCEEKVMLAVKIKPDKYGKAISLLLSMGGGFQTRFERTLIVNSMQRQALEAAGFVATNGKRQTKRKNSGEKAK